MTDRSGLEVSTASEAVRLGEAIKRIAERDETIRSLRSRVEWQPIETAPKDGTKVDLFYPGQRGRVAGAAWEEAPFNCWAVRRRKFSKFQLEPMKLPELLPESEWDHVVFPNEQPTHWLAPPAPPLKHKDTQ